MTWQEGDAQICPYLVLLPDLPTGGLYSTAPDMHGGSTPHVRRDAASGPVRPLGHSPPHPPQAAWQRGPHHQQLEMPAVPSALRKARRGRKACPLTPSAYTASLWNGGH